MAKKHTNHVQCRLHKGTAVMVAWIPESCAIVGKTVDLDDPENGEALGWLVTETMTVMDSDKVREQSRFHKTQREGSDI